MGLWTTFLAACFREPILPCASLKWDAVGEFWWHWPTGSTKHKLHKSEDIFHSFNIFTSLFLKITPHPTYLHNSPFKKEKKRQQCLWCQMEGLVLKYRLVSKGQGYSDSVNFFSLLLAVWLFPLCCLPAEDKQIGIQHIIGNIRLSWTLRIYFYCFYFFNFNTRHFFSKVCLC